MLKEMGAKTIVGFPWKMQEKFRVYRFCLKRYLLVIFASPKLALGRFCLDRRPATSGIARTPFSPNVESEGIARRGLRTLRALLLIYPTMPCKLLATFGLRTAARTK